MNWMKANQKKDQVNQSVVKVLAAGMKRGIAIGKQSESLVKQVAIMKLQPQARMNMKWVVSRRK